MTLRVAGSHIVVDGPLQGVPLLMLHGATVPHWEFDGVVPLLVSAGFRVLRFDFFGHGDSDRPSIDYSVDDFVAQAESVMRAVSWPAGGHVLGHSLGAAVAASLVARNPARFDRVVLSAPLFDFSRDNPAGRWMRAPIVGEVLMHTVGLPYLVRRRRRRYAAIGRAALGERFREQARARGFGRALLRMERNGALGSQEARYRAFAALGKRALVLRGTRDQVLREFDAAKVATITRAESRSLARLGHNMMLADPRRVAHRLVAFLGARPSESPARDLPLVSASAAQPACRATEVLETNSA